MDKLGYYISEPTSGDYLYKCMNGMCDIIAYKDLKYIKNIDEILKNGCCFILVETKQNTGHWIALIKLNNNNVEVFNSYGGYIDYYLYYVPENLRKKLGEDYPHLTALLLDSPYKIHYNDHKIQKDGNEIATCGRHCVIRAKNKKMYIDEYFKWLKSLKFSPDEAVTMLTLDMVPGK